jgi:hypothetical protein
LKDWLYNRRLKTGDLRPKLGFSFKSKVLRLWFSTLILFWVLGLWSSVFPQIHKDSSLIISWASEVVIERGYVNISDTSKTDMDSNRASAGEVDNALGIADGSIVSLGDGGRATYFLSSPLTDHFGPDFAIFENGFKEKTPPYLWFLELAVVEVSSDGENYVRFPAVSNTQTETQLPTFGQLQPDNLYNLAGKYPVFYGTPFDLSELKDSSAIDVMRITHIRIIDVVGSLDAQYGTVDSQGNMINDPFPTPFWTGGFDLDGLAILGESSGKADPYIGFDLLKVWPNPASATQGINVQTGGKEVLFHVVDNLGRIMLTEKHAGDFTFKLAKPGIYHVIISSVNERKTLKLIVH